MKEPIQSSQSAVLCVVDINEPSTSSLQWARKSAEGHQSHLTVLYPYRLTQLEKRADLSHARIEAGKNAMSSFVRELEPLLKSTPYTYDFQPEVGFLSDRVLAHTTKENIVLIVMSATLARANNDGVQELMDAIEVPLVIVPHIKK